jgi:hypothetical protein
MLNLVLSKIRNQMEKQLGYTFIPDWQIRDIYGPELLKNMETDGIEEEIEYKFYSIAEEDHQFWKEDK